MANVRQKKKQAKKPQFHYSKDQRKEAHRIASAKSRRKTKMNERMEFISDFAVEAYLQVRAASTGTKETFAKHRRELYCDDTNDQDADCIHYFSNDQYYFQLDIRDVLLADGRENKARELHDRLGFSGDFDDYKNNFYESIGIIKETMLVAGDKTYQKAKAEYEAFGKQQEQYRKQAEKEWRKNVRNKSGKGSKRKQD